MATDDERQLVAARLRMADEHDAVGFDCLLAEAVRGREFCEPPCEFCRRRVLADLADLIEPAPKRSEPAPDSHPSCGTAEAATSQVPQCDRDALLELAGMLELEAEKMAAIAEEGYGQMTMRLMRKVASTLSLVAEAVRSACGGRAAGEPEFWRCPFTQGPCDDMCMLATTVYATTPDFMGGTPTVDADRPLGWSCTLRKDAGERYNAPRGEEP